MQNKEYSKNYYNKLNFNKNNNLSKLQKLFLFINNIFPILSTYYYYLYKIIISLPQNSKVLDVGVANGTFLNFIHKVRPDLELYGLDITDTKDLLPDYINFIKNDATNFKLDTKFDLIISNHLIEHLQVNQVPGMLKSIKNHLKNNGIFWFTVPTLSKSFYNDPTHIRPYNKESMKTLLKITGLNINKIYEKYYFNFPITIFTHGKLKITFGYSKNENTSSNS